MAYGVTSTTLLLAVGLTPALASTVVHISETGTTLASGISHWRFGNVDWSKVLWLAIPGAIGAVLGTYVLSSVLDAAVAEPIVAIFLFLLGGYVLFRFAFNRTANVVNNLPIPRTFLSPLGLVAGFLDAVGGGGWGPISTPTLLSSGRMEPRKVVGTAVGGFILLVNAKTFLEAVGFNPELNIIVYVAILAVWITALYFAYAAIRRERKPVLET